MNIRLAGVLDPAIAQSLIVIAAAIAMLITRITSYYFPKGVTRFDKGKKKRRKKERDKEDDDDDDDDKKFFDLSDW